VYEVPGLWQDIKYSDTPSGCGRKSNKSQNEKKQKHILNMYKKNKLKAESSSHLSWWS
jgi:hypothetical protein